MTELKHGSNVAGLQTEAILDVHTDEWIVNVRINRARTADLVDSHVTNGPLSVDGVAWARVALDMPRAAPCGCPGGHARHVPVHRRGSWLRFTALPLACPGQTPDDGAIKWWIGNAAEDGKLATVFARLKVRAQPLASAAAQWHRRGGGRGRQSGQLSCCSRSRRAQRFGLCIRHVRSSQPSLPCKQVPAPDGSGALDDHGVVSPAPGWEHVSYKSMRQSACSKYSGPSAPGGWGVGGREGCAQ